MGFAGSERGDKESVWDFRYIVEEEGFGRGWGIIMRFLVVF